MFQVTNLLTFQSWSATTRDELLSELEHMNARRQPLDPPETVEIVHVDDEGEIMEERFLLEFPLQGTIDEVLEEFGYGKAKTPKHSKPGFFKRLFFRSKDKPKEDLSLDNSSPEEIEPEQDKKAEDSAQLTTEAPNHQGVLGQLLEQTAKDPEADDGQSPSSQEPMKEGQLATEEDETTQPSSEPFNDVSESSDEVTEKPALVSEPPSSPALDSAKPAYLPEASSAEPVIPPAQVGPRDLESLSTYDLQREFVGRIDKEVASIDVKIQDLLDQAARLERQKLSHLKLLETITAHQLN